MYDYASCAEQPMLALAQGMTLRGGYKRPAADGMDDCKPVLDIIRSGKLVAYVHSVSLYHHTIRSLDHFMRKQRWATRNAITKESYGISHRSSLLSAGQKIRIKWWPLYAFSFFAPLLRALWGLWMDRKVIWLFHPFICWLSASASVIEVLHYRLQRNQSVSRQ